MAITQITAEVLHIHKADLSELKRELKEAEADQKALAKAELEAAESRNEHLEKWIGQLAKVGIAVGVLKEGLDVIFEGYREGVKEARLESAAYGVDIEKLSEAAGGLKTHMELLEFAAKTHAGAFRLNTEQLEIAEKAMRALTERGMDAAQVQEAFTTALTTGRVRGLEPYIGFVDKGNLKLNEQGEIMGTAAQKTEILTRLFEKLGETAKEAGEGEGAMGEDGQRAAVQLHDAWEKLKISMGSLAESMMPVITNLAKIASGLANLAKFDMPDLPTLSFGGDLAAGILGANLKDKFTAGDDNWMAALKRGLASRRRDAADRQAAMYPEVSMEGAETDFAKEAEVARKYADEMARINREYGQYERTERDRFDARQAERKAERFGSGKLGAVAQDDSSFDTQLAIDQHETERVAKLTDDWFKNLDKYRSEKETALEKVFGKPSDLQLYTKAFDALTNATGAMYDAIVTGSEPAGKAFEHMIAMSVQAAGKQMAVEAIKETGLGLASLALGPIGGVSAAGHFAAAAELSAGAILAGAVASELGVGGGGSSGGGGGGGYAAVGGGGGGAGGSGGSGSTAGKPTAPVIIVMNDPADGSLRQKQSKAAQTITLALGASGIKNE